MNVDRSPYGMTDNNKEHVLIKKHNQLSIHPVKPNQSNDMSLGEADVIQAGGLLLP